MPDNTIIPKSFKISPEEALSVAQTNYHLTGTLSHLPGEIDYNFRLETPTGEKYILKISRPSFDQELLEFQTALLKYLAKSEKKIRVPEQFPDVEGDFLGEMTDKNGEIRKVRLLAWIEGRTWSGVNPIQAKLRLGLGRLAGQVTQALAGFRHSGDSRRLQWDLAQSTWTYGHTHRFAGSRLQIILYFQRKFEAIQDSYRKLRKSAIHNDVNDYNILVSEDSKQPEVRALIDFGDSLYTQTINDLAIAIAYAVMDTPDPLQAALPLVRGYHESFPLQPKELVCLHTLVGMRLVISVTKSAINRQAEPDNPYLLISENDAWNLLEKWREIQPEQAHFAFRQACGLVPHPQKQAVTEWASKNRVSLKDLFPSLAFSKTQPIDTSLSSTWLGHASEFNDLPLFQFRLKRLQQENPNALLAGGYLETRAFYSTQAYQKEGNSGPEFRTIHIGTDFWVEAQIPVHAPWAGTVFSIADNAGDKNYGPTLIMEHRTDKGIPFFSLYGHLSKSSLEMLKPGDYVEAGMPIGQIGNMLENGNWVPHLHFQLMLDMLGNDQDFPGVCYPHETEVWASICPDPNTFFQENILQKKEEFSKAELLQIRQQQLGQSLSISYAEPLQMVRGDGAFLIDHTGRRYLDTVNNVAHVGHEHPRVVKAGQAQMGLLNTNTRYLHPNLTDFSEALLATFPPELCVVHFVNSGSEASELALRMARTFTGQKDMIALEIGYHGNTGAAVEVSSYKFDGKGGGGSPPYTHLVPLPDTFRGLFTGPDAAEKYAAHIDQQISMLKAQNQGLAGFIHESIVSCGGQIELPEGYLANAYAMVRKAGGLCLADEVQTGVGRMGSTFWGFQLHDVVPDIVTIGKPISNGHPLAAVVCTRAVADGFANGMEFFSTFGGNPVSCAIGLEVLRVVQDENLQENALKVGNFLKNELRKLSQQFSILQDVRGQGLFLGFELVDADKNPLPEHASYIANRMRELGILMGTDGKDHNAIKIKPPMVFSMENAQELLLRLAKVLKEDFMRQ